MKYKIFAIILGLCSVGLSGCDKEFVSINTDPEHVTPATMNYAYLFTAAELITSGNSDANAYEDWRNNLIYCSTMIQHLSSSTTYWCGDKYLYNSGYNSAYWEQNYGDPIKNIQDVVGNIKDQTDQANFYNIARIFRAFMFQRMTDMYGDCPYSEAGQGYLQGITSPKYDKQSDIYADMLNELKEAAGALDASAPNTVGSADVLYGGDVAKWKKFAYSEMLRLAMRMVKVDAAQAQQWAQTAVSGGVMSSIDDNALFSHNGYTPGTATIFGSGWVLDGVDANASRISTMFMNVLKSTNDPRLPYIATVSTNPNDVSDLGDNTPSIQKGQPNGWDNGGGPTDIKNAPGYPGNQNLYSIVNRQTWSRYDAPTYFLTYAETSLLEAEAVVRGWITGDAATFYNNGVRAAMDQYGQMSASESSSPATLPAIPQGDIDTYLAANPYNPGDAINQINTQYWIATFMDEYESWANWRRTGYPVLLPVPAYVGNVTNGQVPRRFTYSVGEVSTNADNYAAAVQDLDNGDKMTSHMWWDKP
ncbi:MAG TPA: SusD/RagB family nutrient-binding outer membrane lipoprotein [Puia sp.]|nr:SusD/RagB family nutrient-binding outer membrane lipoprotein [Puia sp.]